MTSRTEIAELIHHPWAVPLKRAAIIQTQLAEHVRLVPLTSTPNIVAGIDYAERGDHLFLALVVMSLDSDKVVEIQSVEGIASFPKNPGYEAFRYGPLVSKAIRGLYRRPQLYFVNGAGVCHPRLCGMASHLGLRFGISTIGCTLDRQGGHYEPPSEKAGAYSVIRYTPQAPGVVLRTRIGVNPIFISPGHKIDLLGAVAQTIRCCTRYRLPEPLRRAHVEAGRFMRIRLAERDKRQTSESPAVRL